MSYSEENGRVTLTMSREDYEVILMALGAFTVYAYDRNRILALLDRVNEGNPAYTPYQVKET